MLLLVCCLSYRSVEHTYIAGNNIATHVALIITILFAVVIAMHFLTLCIQDMQPQQEGAESRMCEGRLISVLYGTTTHSEYSTIPKYADLPVTGELAGGPL